MGPGNALLMLFTESCDWNASISASAIDWMWRLTSERERESWLGKACITLKSYGQYKDCRADCNTTGLYVKSMQPRPEKKAF